MCERCDKTRQLLIGKRVMADTLDEFDDIVHVFGVVIDYSYKCATILTDNDCEIETDVRTVEIQ